MIAIRPTPSTFAGLDEAPGCDGGCSTEHGLEFRFSFAYQPIVDVVTRQVYAQEALVRGAAGESAMSVLSLVNDTNRYRFDQACRVKAIKGAAQLGLQQLLSINFLPNAIYKPEVCIRATLAAARQHDFPIERIVFETTEGERVDDARWLQEVMTEYKRMGFRVAIDDFGAGYAGLNLFADFQPDIVKLDMALVRGVEASLPRRAIVSGVLRICEQLGIEVIAEGIETAAERDCLRDLGVRLMQGYLFARPALDALPEPAASAWPSR